MNKDKNITLTCGLLFFAIVMTAVIIYDGISYRNWSYGGYIFKGIIPLAVTIMYVIFASRAAEKKEGLIIGAAGIFLSHIFILYGFDTLGKDRGTYISYMATYYIITNIVAILLYITAFVGIYRYIKKNDCRKEICEIPMFLVIGYKVFDSLNIISNYIYSVERNFKVDAQSIFASVFVNMLFVFQLFAVYFSLKIKEERN